MLFENVNFEITLIIRILIAGLCGFVVGFERKNRYKEAGTRTHVIVAIGSALIICVSKYGFEDVSNYDAARIAAQVVSGIGFLGAGMIMVKKQSVSGLTTAAGIWATSGIGLAIGSGLYLVGFLSSLLIVVVQILLHCHIFQQKDYQIDQINMLIDLTSETKLNEIQQYLKLENILIVDISVTRKEKETLFVEFVWKVPQKEVLFDIGELMMKFPSILSIEC